MPPEVAETIPISGSPESSAERFAAYAAVGADHLVVAPTEGGWLDRCEFVAEALALVR
jgi:hypothetical protein